MTSFFLHLTPGGAKSRRMRGRTEQAGGAGKAGEAGEARAGEREGAERSGLVEVKGERGREREGVLVFTTCVELS